ncbi:SRPBCC family protein [Aliiglaciecola sp. CAU 1673]|uniref:SRPBCC family protein n=1 Tax=Aliiglaciecola sp. CAU 1673 TaxID=3032595 RepID=UPI0023D9F855|nr:SRPBCC family protein [Aliiglaciecola sp. CAU 1673]MDF2177255.1 SRPBCC family protein [Aliiglaciecola sp. CAU 1673]
MDLLKKLVMALLILVLLFVGVGFILPSEFKVERSISIDAPADKVYAQVVDLKNWRNWGVWFQRDPAMQVSYEGPEAEVGMVSKWVSESEGNGEMKIIAADANKRLVYSLYFPDFEMGSTGEIVLKEADGKTEVIWQDYGDVGSNPINHYFAAMMDSMVGPDFETGLENLKVLVENRH